MSVFLFLCLYQDSVTIETRDTVLLKSPSLSLLARLSTEKSLPHAGQRFQFSQVGVSLQMPKSMNFLWSLKASSPFLIPHICLLYFNKEFLLNTSSIVQVSFGSIARKGDHVFFVQSFHCFLNIFLLIVGSLFFPLFNRCMDLRQHRGSSFKAR